MKVDFLIWFVAVYLMEEGRGAARKDVIEQTRVGGFVFPMVEEADARRTDVPVLPKDPPNNALLTVEALVARKRDAVS